MFGSTTKIWIGLALFAGIVSGEVQTDRPVAPTPELDELATLESLLRYAQEHSPALQAKRHREQAARAEVERARALPDPALRVAVAAVPIETRVGPQHGQVSLGQTLPAPGKRPARAALARAAAAATAQDLERESWRLRFDVASAYFDLYMLARSVEITRDNRDVLVYLEQVVRKAYETGNARYADLIRAQVEIGKLENDLRSLADQRRSAEQRVNSLLHRPPGAPLPEPRIAETDLTFRPEAELRTLIDSSAPEIALLDAVLETEQRRVRLAEIDDRPDWNVSLSYFPTGPAINPATPDSGQDPLLAAVSVNLPLGKAKYRAAERQARERHSAVLQEREAARERLRDRLERLLYATRNAEREMRLYRDTLLPKARQSLEASQASFRTGSVSALDLVDATRVLLQFQLAFERAKTDRARAVAELEQLLGAPVVTASPSEPQGDAS